MKRTTIALVAVLALGAGSLGGGLLFAKPAWDEQTRLKQEQFSLSQQKSSLQLQVGTLDAKLKGMAMDTIAYFDLRKSPNQPRELEAKTVATLASITEIFNDNHVRIAAVQPRGETSGLNKLMASPTPAPSASPGAVPSPSVPPSEPPISLTHKQYAFQVLGEYADLVKALDEIEALPKAISINQYDVRLLDRRDGQPAQKVAGATAASPSLLSLSFQLSITYLLAGGVSPVPAPSMSVGTLGAPFARLADLLLGGPAYAAAAGPAKAHRLTALRAEKGTLVLDTGYGSPHYRIVGRPGRSTLMLDLMRTTPALAEQTITYASGPIREVRVVSRKEGPTAITRLTVVAAHGEALTPGLDALQHLVIRAGKPARAASSAPIKPAAASAPEKKPAQVAPPHPRKPQPVAALVPPSPRPSPRRATPHPRPTTAPVALELPAGLAAAPFAPEAPQLRRSLASSYRFPIARERVAGRQNPFKVPPTRAIAAPTGVALPPAPQAPGLPALPPTPPQAPGAPALPGAPAAGNQYELQAVLLGGGQPPLAVLAVDGKPWSVGLNGILPGNARVKAIQPDFVLLVSNGQTRRLDLKK